MGLVKVTTPVPDYSGSVGGVHFAGGVGYADPDQHESELDYFRTRGYTVHDDDEPAAEVEEPSDVDEVVVEQPEPRPAGNASTETWRTWAVDHGGMSAEEAGALSRDQLVERFAETETES
jgi:hypothetical protein